MFVLQNCLQFLLSLTAASALSSGITLLLGTAAYSFSRTQDRTHSRETLSHCSLPVWTLLRLHRDYLFGSPHCELLEGKEHAFHTCVPPPWLLLKMSTVLGPGSAQMARTLSLPMVEKEKWKHQQIVTVWFDVYHVTGVFKTRKKQHLILRSREFY